MKIVPGFENVPVEKIGEEAWKFMEDCRQTVGYQKDPNWECPRLISGDSDSLREQYPGKYVGGLNCYHCLAIETRDWQSQGLPIPVAQTAHFAEGETRPVKYEV